MTTRYRTSLLAVTLLSVSWLAGCGGSDSDPAAEPSVVRTSATPVASATPDPDGLTPEQREVVDVVQAYSAAFYNRGTESVTDAAAQFVTPDLIDFLRDGEKQILQDGKFQYLGSAVIRPDRVTIDGDTATFRGCSDASKAAIVPVGETRVTAPGARVIGYTELTWGLVRTNGRWLVSDPKGQPVASC